MYIRICTTEILCIGNDIMKDLFLLEATLYFVKCLLTLMNFAARRIVGLWALGTSDLQAPSPTSRYPNFDTLYQAEEDYEIGACSLVSLIPPSISELLSLSPPLPFYDSVFKMLSGILIFNQKGENLIFRAFRNDVSLQPLGAKFSQTRWPREGV
jgi:hypothetical protein